MLNQMLTTGLGGTIPLLIGWPTLARESKRWRLSERIAVPNSCSHYLKRRLIVGLSLPNQWLLILDVAVRSAHLVITVDLSSSGVCSVITLGYTLH